MDPDASIPRDQPPVINYVLSFLLVGVAWGFTTPFIRRAAADFNARQDAKRNLNQDTTIPTEREGEEDEGQELLGGDQDRSREENVNEGDEERDEGNTSDNSNQQPINENSRTSQGQQQPQPQPAWLNPPLTRAAWVKNKLITLFWTIINLLRTPAYSIPLVINLTGSIWFFLLVGKHGTYIHPLPAIHLNGDMADQTELSLTVPLANSSAFLFTVLGEWYVERKVIAKETWVGLIFVLAGIAVCVQAKNQSG